MSGRKIEGVVLSFDNFSLVVRGESDSSDQLIYKHAISSISLKGKITVSENKPSQG
jgi:RNA chaperone Hfq